MGMNTAYRLCLDIGPILRDKDKYERYNTHKTM